MDWAAHLAVDSPTACFGEAAAEVRIFSLQTQSFPEANASRPDEYHVTGVALMPASVSPAPVPRAVRAPRAKVAWSFLERFGAEGMRRHQRLPNQRSRPPPQEPDPRPDPSPEEEPEHAELRDLSGAADDEMAAALEELWLFEPDDEGPPAGAPAAGGDDEEEDGGNDDVSPLDSFTHPKLVECWEKAKVCEVLGLDTSLFHWVRNSQREQLGTISWVSPGEVLKVGCKAHDPSRCKMFLTVPDWCAGCGSDEFFYQGYTECVGLKWLAQCRHLSREEHADLRMECLGLFKSSLQSEAAGSR